MLYDFDTIINRMHTDNIKWRHFAPDVLPLWVADMDFVSPEPVIRALHDRVDHGIFGYGCDPCALRDTIVERLARLYDWRVEPEALVFVPGVVTGFNVALRNLAQPGEGVLVQTPVYPPILSGPRLHRLCRQDAPLTQGADGRYAIDMAAFEATVTDETRIFLMSNPHNPVGRVFTRQELTAMAEVCLRHNLTIVSDEIHCDLLFAPYRHIPIATLDPEVARRTVTLIAPSKTFNIAGLHTSVAIIENPELRRQYDEGREELVGMPNILGMVAAQAAYSEGQEWLEQMLAYLTANRDFLAQYVAERLPGVHMTVPEGTYLAWLDCRDAGISGSPAEFFLNHARVALNDGRTFGMGGDGFVRLNFGCPRVALEAALDRMSAALGTLS